MTTLLERTTEFFGTNDANKAEGIEKAYQAARSAWEDFSLENSLKGEDFTKMRDEIKDAFRKIESGQKEEMMEWSAEQFEPSGMGDRITTSSIAGWAVENGQQEL